MNNSQNKINFLDTQEESKKNDTDKRRKIFRILFYPVIFLMIFFVIFSFSVIISGDNITDNLRVSFLPFHTFSIIGEKPLVEGTDRINFLLTGMGGPGHDGPYLTDTIIFASLNSQTHQVGLLSVPRDLSIPVPGNGWIKINYLNHYGEMKNPGSGAPYAAEVIGQTLNQPINYYIRLDFDGFEKLIDEFGGVDIYVDNSFTDYEYPAPNDAYQTISFAKGWQKMDGQTALIYARSRHGNNGEASDFARSKRQQKVLMALQEKAFSFNTFFDLKKINAIYEMYSKHVTTNLSATEIIQLIKIAKKIKPENINNIVLDNSPSGLLYSAFVNGAYVLLPKDDSFFEIKNLAENIFTKQKEIKYNPTVLEIQNGTKIEGLAYKTSVKLEAKGYRVVKIGNAQKQDYDKTSIYDFTNGQKSENLNQLKELLATNLVLNSALSNVNNASSVDFIIVLGQDQNK